MSTTLDVEEIQTTRGEKLLAVVLVAFLLIGGVWTYQRSTTSSAHRRRPTSRTGHAGGASGGHARETGAARAITSRDGRRRSAPEPRAAARGVPDRARRGPARGRNSSGPTTRHRRGSPGSSASSPRREAISRAARPAAEAASATSPRVQAGRTERQRAARVPLPARVRDPGDRVRVLAARVHAPERLPLVPDRDRGRRVRGDPRASSWRCGLPDGLLRSARAGAARGLAVRDRVDPARLRRPPALPGAASSGSGASGKEECPSAGTRPGRTSTARDAAERSIAPCARCSEARRVGALHCGALRGHLRRPPRRMVCQSTSQSCAVRSERLPVENNGYARR